MEELNMENKTVDQATTPEVAAQTPAPVRAERAPRGERHERNFDRRNQDKHTAHVCSLRRVTRVTKGGKAMRFSALVVVGDEKGRVGYGLGRSVEVSEAVKKATKVAEKHMIHVPFRQNRTIYHDIYEEYCGAKVYLRSAKNGRGIIAGGSMRYIFEALGIKDIVCKSVGSPNPHNIVKATFNALKKIQTPRKLAKLRDVPLSHLFAPGKDYNVASVTSK